MVTQLAGGHREVFVSQEHRHIAGHSQDHLLEESATKDLPNYSEYPTVKNDHMPSKSDPFECADGPCQWLFDKTFLGKQIKGWCAACVEQSSL